MFEHWNRYLRETTERLNAEKAQTSQPVGPEVGRAQSHKRRETRAQEARRNMIRRTDGTDESMEPVQPMAKPPDYSVALLERIRKSVVSALGRRFPYVCDIELFIFSGDEERRLGCDGEAQLDAGKIGISANLLRPDSDMKYTVMVVLHEYTHHFADKQHKNGLGPHNAEFWKWNKMLTDFYNRRTGWNIPVEDPGILDQ